MIMDFCEQQKIIFPDEVIPRKGQRITLTGVLGIDAHHSWSPFDDDGYASSQYSHHVEIMLGNEVVNI